MKVRPCINCYTITFEEKNAYLVPGIPIQLFEDMITQDFKTLSLNASPICRFAIEDQFNHLDSSYEKYWLVVDEANNYYYRFFPNFPSEGNDYVYFLILGDLTNEKWDFSSSSYFIVEENQAFLKVPRKQSITFKNKNIFVSDFDVLIY